MPVIDITYPEGTFSLEQKQQLVHDLSHALVKWEGNAADPTAIGRAWVYLKEIPRQNYAVGGVLQLQTPQIRYFVNVLVPDGILDQERKNGLVADVTLFLLEAEGSATDFANSLRVYCLIHDIRDGNWGTANKGLTLREMAALTGAR